MATPLGTNFSTDEKIVAQADVKFLGSMVESLIVEFDQENLKNFSLRALKAQRQRGNTTKSLLGLALKSLQRLLQK